MNYPEKVIYKDGSTNLQTVVYADKEGIERCAYGENGDLTVAEYLTKNPGLVCISFDEAMRRMNTAEESAYIKPWTEITEDQWQDALEVLPPQKWQTVNGVELFRMSEYTTGNITAHYARIDDKHFCANRRTSDSYETLAAQIRAGV